MLCPKCQLKTAGSKNVKITTVYIIDDVQHYGHTKILNQTMCGLPLPSKT